MAVRRHHDVDSPFAVCRFRLRIRVSAALSPASVNGNDLIAGKYSHSALGSSFTRSNVSSVVRIPYLRLMLASPFRFGPVQACCGRASILARVCSGPGKPLEDQECRCGVSRGADRPLHSSWPWDRRPSIPLRKRRDRMVVLGLALWLPPSVSQAALISGRAEAMQAGCSIPA